jgi:hypothetical protein
MTRQQLSPRARKALRRGPRPRARLPRAQTAPIGAAEAPAGRVLAEWHEMTPGQLAAEWSGLRAWVAWLHGRYELAVEERLPRCWAQHPGLIEELSALRAWRAEIYASGQPGTGQAALYWHSELRRVIQAATTVYAAGCRTGHRGAPALAAIGREVLDEWGGAYPLAGIPEIDITAGQARGTSDWATGDEIAVALDLGDAEPVPESELVKHAGAYWAAAAGGWVQVPGLGAPGSGRSREEGRSWTR